MRTNDTGKVRDPFSGPQARALLNGPVRNSLNLKVLRQSGRKDFLVGRYPQSNYRGGSPIFPDLGPSNS